MRELFAWGSNSSGQCGIGTLDDAVQPQLSFRGDVLSVHVGGYHAFMIVRDGEKSESNALTKGDRPSLYATGGNDHGQLGFQTESGSAIMVWKRVENIPAGPASVACGWSHTVLLTHSGRVFTCGSNSFGQLGRTLSEGKYSASFEGPLDIPTAVVKVASGLRHCLALTADGVVYAWGANRHGQCGSSEKVSTMSSPRLLSNVGSVVRDLAAGRRHSLLLCESGEVLVFGRSEHNLFRIGVVDAELGCQRFMPDFRAVEVHSGWDHAFLVGKNSLGETVALGWGRNDRGQLGISGDSGVLPLRSIQKLSLGTEHTLVLLGKRDCAPLQSRPNASQRTLRCTPLAGTSMGTWALGMNRIVWNPFWCFVTA